MTGRPARRWRGALALAATAAALSITLRMDGSAHPGGVGVTWSATVGPILERRCIGCHGPSGFAAPRLDGYANAVAASSAIKRAALSRHAPGWHAARGIRGFANDRAPSPAEAELLAQWADARAPRGDDVAPAADVRDPEPEDRSLLLRVETKHRIAAGTHTFVLPTGLDAAAWIRGWRFEAGNAPLVTGAVLALASGRTLGTWAPGDAATFLPDGAGIRLAARAPVRLTVFYRRPDGPAVDASRVTLYFRDGPQRAVESRTVGCGTTNIAEPMQTLALRPLSGTAGASISVSVRSADRVQPVARFKDYQEGQTQTYWLFDPMPLRRGTSIDIQSDGARCAVEVIYVEGTKTIGPRVGRVPAAIAQDVIPYWCPMHADVKSPVAGECPRCGMALVPVRPRVEGEYRLDATVLPAPGARGAATIRLTVREPGGGAPVREFETVHERPFHLFVLGDDLEDFAHVHPVATADGGLEVPFAPRRAGAYRLFADFFPRGGTPQLISRAIVAGTPRGIDVAPRAEPELDAAPKTSGGMRIDVRPDAAMRAGDPSLIAFRLRDTVSGAPISDLEPFLGAWGHLFIASSNLEDAVHSHPTASLSTPPAGEVFFSQRFPRPGVYRLWAQFMRRGRLSTVSFTLRVS